MSGVVSNCALITPTSRQYSPLRFFGAAAATTDAPRMVAPRVGKPIADAGTDWPSSSAQCLTTYDAALACVLHANTAVNSSSARRRGVVAWGIAYWVNCCGA